MDVEFFLTFLIKLQQYKSESFQVFGLDGAQKEVFQVLWEIIAWSFLDCLHDVTAS